jgi:phenylalanine-4-hydroxylase
VIAREPFVAFGAGQLTSGAELEHSIIAVAKHAPYDVNVLRDSNYAIDTFQTRYFVLESFQELLEKEPSKYL